VVGSAAACVAFDAPVWTVFVLGTLAGLIGCVFRPTQMAWMPSLTNRPDELTAANGTASTVESLAFFIGPAIGAALVMATSVDLVFLLNALTFIVSALIVLGIRPVVVDVLPEAADGADADGPGMLAEMAAGFSTIRRDRDLVVIAVLTIVQTIVAGAMVVFAVALAVDILGTGAAGVGYIDSVFGIGAIAGGLFAIARAARNRLAVDLAIGTLLWSAPLLLVVAVPHPAMVFVVAAVMGFGNPLVDVNAMTIIQRIAPAAVLGRVFGALEGGLIGGMAIGSAAMPFLIDQLGLRGALAVLAVVVVVPTLALLPRCRALDARLVEPAGTAWLRAIPMFAPLRRDTLEGLAARLVPETAAAGTAIVSEGEVSDRFLIITKGSVEVSQHGAVLRIQDVGDHFGEIGLLRDVPRTATVTALEDTELLSLARDDFLEAVSGGEARAAADAVVTRRLGRA
jgi:MFS family permease